MANLTDADKVIRNDVGKSIVSKLDDIADAIVAQGGGAHSLGQLSDVDIDTTTLAEGQSIVYNETTQKFENGQVSTVGGLNDLDDVTLTNVTNKQELVYDDVDDVFKNKTTRVELTQAEYDALANPLPDVDYYITDAPSMSGSSKDLSYDGGTDSTHDVIQAIRDMIYPVGSIYMSVTDDTVAKVEARFGGTWVRFAEGTTVFGYKSDNAKFDSVTGSKNGGNETHTLTYNEMPTRSIVQARNTASSTLTGMSGQPWDGNVSVGSSQGMMSSIADVYGNASRGMRIWGESNPQQGGQAQDILNPYTTTYIYRRTA